MKESYYEAEGNKENGKTGASDSGGREIRRRRMRKYRLFTSFQKECGWLEKMASEGWFLTDICLGVCYTFERGEPRRLLYDIDRFSLPKNPTLEEIQHKEFFLEMARELGWHEVTHDEGMTYYFAKEYEEGGINELHNDPESRWRRAAKFREAINKEGSHLVFWGLVVLLIDVGVKLIGALLGEPDPYLVWYDWFAFAYVIFSNGFAVWCRRYGIRVERELRLTRAEWEASRDPFVHREVRKLILTNRGLRRFLEEQEAQGFVLTALTATRYFFERSGISGQIYTMDSKRLVNKRLRARQQRAIRDGKDWTGQNNDWEIESVREAERLGWHFVCALENRAIIYRGVEKAVQLLNDPRYDKGFRGVSLIGEYGLLLLFSGAAGAVVGFFMG